MIPFLAGVAREARKRRGIKIARIAVAADLDPSTIYRFERGHWPGNPDVVIAAYAEELEVSQLALWKCAFDRWSAEEHGVGHEC